MRNGLHFTLLFLSYGGSLTLTAQLTVQLNLSEGVTQGKGKKWLLKSGDHLIKVHLPCILVQGIKKKWLHKTGDPLIEMTTSAVLIVIQVFPVINTVQYITYLHLESTAVALFVC